MSVIVIGNRQVGKTSMVVALAKGTENVEVIRPDPQSLIAEKSNPKTGEIAGTDRKQEKSLLLRVALPSQPLGGREVQVHWIDTPGEAWSKPEWKKNNLEKWQDLIEAVSQSRAVLLLLPPYIYRSRPQNSEEQREPEELDPETWKAQLKDWLAFLRKYCPRVQHILISIHKADLFCYNLEDEAEDWRYDPFNQFRWLDYDNHVRNTYFGLADDIIRQHNTQPPYLSPQFFITTIKSPTLLELPWVYLGSHLAYA